MHVRACKDIRHVHVGRNEAEGLVSVRACEGIRQRSEAQAGAIYARPEAGGGGPRALISPPTLPRNPQTQFRCVCIDHVTA
eukprot:650950-Rhodomonas_salina.2